MSKHNNPEKIPHWILQEINAQSSSLRPESLKFFAKIAELYPHFCKHYVGGPDSGELTVVSTFDLDVIHEAYPQKDPRMLILRSAYEQFYFIAGFQIKELARSLNRSLEEGEFYTSAIMTRSILEICSCSHYILRRLQNRFDEMSKLATIVSKSGSNTHKYKAQNDFSIKLYESFACLHRANTASKFPWKEHLKRFGVELENIDFGKELHTQTCVEDVGKAYKQPLQECYKVLSEFVHPNFGSKTLLIGTRIFVNKATDSIKVGNVRRDEKCIWFVDQISESLYYTINLALTFAQVGEYLYNFICDASEGALNTYH